MSLFTQSSTQSTTTLSNSWELQKYSRATTRGGQPDPVSASRTGALDWQEVTQAGLVASLDVVRVQGYPTQLQLKVAWHGNTIYEDLDLNALAMPPGFKEVPCKCAFKDLVVGFRVVWLRNDHPPAWRRFQLKFASKSDASAFVNLIKPYIPTRVTGEPNELESQVPARGFSQPPSHSTPSRPLTTTESAVVSLDLADTQSVQSIVSALYASEKDGGLSDAELAKAIEAIICEDGFVPFVERVSKMWKARMAVGA